MQLEVGECVMLLFHANKYPTFPEDNSHCATWGCRVCDAPCFMLTKIPPSTCYYLWFLLPTYSRTMIPEASIIVRALKYFEVESEVKTAWRVDCCMNPHFRRHQSVSCVRALVFRKHLRFCGYWKLCTASTHPLLCVVNPTMHILICAIYIW